MCLVIMRFLFNTEGGLMENTDVKNYKSELLSALVLQVSAFALTLVLCVFLIVMYCTNAALTCTDSLKGYGFQTLACALFYGVLTVIAVLLNKFRPDKRVKLIKIMAFVSFFVQVGYSFIIVFSLILHSFASVFSIWGAYIPMDEIMFISGIYMLMLLVMALSFIYSIVTTHKVKKETRK